MRLLNEGSVTRGTIGNFHDRFIFSRRTKVLADCISPLIPRGARVLDVGCGDGTIDAMLQESRPDIAVQGIDILVRERTHIPVTSFDGSKIPFSGNSFDVVLLVDVLHHTIDPRLMLAEAARVGASVIIKDHLREGKLASTTLRLMDWVGNARHGVVLPYNYWTRAQWQRAFHELGLAVESALSPALYPAPLSWVFGRGLHFVARLRSVSLKDEDRGAQVRLRHLDSGAKPRAK